MNSIALIGERYGCVFGDYGVVRLFFDSSNFWSCRDVYFYEMVHEWTEALKNELAEINQQAHFVFLYVA